jgi:biopolymer transport protein ExbB/TolQ
MNTMLFELVYQADWMSKFVLISLLVMSIVCWAFFFSLIISFNTYRRQTNQALRAIQMVESMDEFLALNIALQDTIVGPLLTRSTKVMRSDRHQKLTTQEFELMQETMYACVHDMVREQEKYLPLFSTSAEISPLIGLFGTVWGLIHSFMRISQFQSADITTVAPGISEALITTLAGLLVAIPALIMFQYGQHQTRIIEESLMRVADRIEWLTKRWFIIESR